MNKVIFSGRLTAAPELRYLNNQDQTAVATYTLAVQRGLFPFGTAFKTKEGNKRYCYVLYPEKVREYLGER